MSTLIFKQAGYDYQKIEGLVFRVMDRFCGDIIRSGTRVLIKPNFLLPAKPERAITTHPMIVKAAASYALKKGAAVKIQDSPAVGSFEKILKTGGYKNLLDGMNLEMTPFSRTVRTEIGPPFGRIDIAREAVESDVVVNLAKLKTHSQMLLTLGVKNMFGTVVGLKKPEWHLRAGIRRDYFARLLVQIYNRISPAITIIDGILGMEGQGPGKRGRPRKIGVLIASKNAVAADMAVCRLLGIKELDLPTNAAAKELGLVPDDISIKGETFSVKNFDLPVLASLGAGPGPIQRLVRKHFIQRPGLDEKLCTGCGECWKYCPARAIAFSNKRPDFNYTACIRCYCCVEICPKGALLAIEPAAGRMLRKASELKRGLTGHAKKPSH